MKRVATAIFSVESRVLTRLGSVSPSELRLAGNSLAYPKLLLETDLVAVLCARPTLCRL